MLRLGDKKIEARHGKHRVSSMWGEVGVRVRGDSTCTISTGPWCLGANFLDG